MSQLKGNFIASPEASNDSNGLTDFENLGNNKDVGSTIRTNRDLTKDISSSECSGPLKMAEVKIEDRSSLATYEIQEDEFRGRVKKFIENIDTRVASNQLILTQNPTSQSLANIQYLRYLQFGFCYLEARFFKEMYALECKYERLLAPLFTLRQQIVEGVVDPKDSDKEDEDGEGDSSPIIGIPEFWLTVFKNSPIMSSIIAQRDEAVLSHLMDVRMRLHETEPAGFSLEFQFSENDFFTNNVLVKAFYLNCMPDESNPLSFDGPVAYRSTGCIIDWNEDMDVTKRQVKKVVRRPNGRVGTITQIVRCSSFFNFFSSNANDSLHYDEVTIGNHIRAIVPKAFLLYVGDIWESEDASVDSDSVLDIEECVVSLGNISI